MVKMRHKSNQIANRAGHNEATFNSVSHGVTTAVLVVECAYLFSGENVSELKETFDRIIEIRWHTNARVWHQAGKLAGVNLRAWNMKD